MWRTTVGMSTPKGRLEAGAEFPGEPPEWLIDGGYVEEIAVIGEPDEQEVDLQVFGEPNDDESEEETEDDG